MRFFPAFLLSVLLAIVGHAQVIPMGLTGTFALLSQNEIKKEIRLTKEQDKQIQGLVDEMQKNPGQVGLMDMHYLTRAIDQKVAGVLQPEQNTRLRELFWQLNGLLALTERDLCEALGLTEEVKAAAKTKIKEHDKAVMDEIMSHKGKFDKKKLEAQKVKTLADLESLLTPEQVEKWKALLGKPFKFPKGMG